MSRKYTIDDNEYYFCNDRFIQEYNNLYLNLYDAGTVKNKEEYLEYFSQKTNFSVETIRSWVKGKNTPAGIEYIKSLAAYFSIDYMKLLSIYQQADFTPYRLLNGAGKKMRNKKMEEIGIKERTVYEKIRYILWNEVPVDVVIMKGEKESENALLVLGDDLLLCSLKRETIADEMKVLDIIHNIVDEDVLEYYFGYYQDRKNAASQIGLYTKEAFEIGVPELDEKWWRREGYEERMEEFEKQLAAIKKYRISPEINLAELSSSLWKGEF